MSGVAPPGLPTNCQALRVEDSDHFVRLFAKPKVDPVGGRFFFGSKVKIRSRTMPPIFCKQQPGVSTLTFRDPFDVAVDHTEVVDEQDS
jgi:hypothetical protein